MNATKRAVTVAVAAMLLAAWASPAGAGAIFEGFPYVGGAPLAGQGPPPGTPPPGTPWPWASTGGSQGRILCNGGTPSQGITVYNDTLLTGVSDEANLGPIDSGGGIITCKIDLKTMFSVSNWPKFWQVNFYSDTNYKLFWLDGTSTTATFHGPTDQWTVGLPLNTQITARADLDFDQGAMSWMFGSTRRGIMKIIPMGYTGPYPDDWFRGQPTLYGTEIDKVEIVSLGKNPGQGPDSAPPNINEFIYMNKLAVADSSHFTSMPMLPEPATIGLLALGGLALIRRRIA